MSIEKVSLTHRGQTRLKNNFHFSHSHLILHSKILIVQGSIYDEFGSSLVRCPLRPNCVFFVA